MIVIVSDDITIVVIISYDITIIVIIITSKIIIIIITIFHHPPPPQVKFLSISHCDQLERLDQSSIALLPLVETITLRWLLNGMAVVVEVVGCGEGMGC